MKKKLFYQNKMKNIIYFILIGSVLPFNLNNLSQISRKEVLNYFSKISLLPFLKNKNINPVQNYEKIIKDEYNQNFLNEDSIEKDETLINTFNNDIYFYAPITKSSCFELEKIIIDLNDKTIIAKKKYDIDNGPINLHIQSNGGSLFQSLYIIDLIRNIETPVHTYIDGFAASAATLISVVGEKRFMTKNSLMLIHQLSGGAIGKFSEIKDENENVDTLMKFIIQTYIKNTKLNEEELESILKRDIWLNSTFCLEKGIVDKIL